MFELDYNGVKIGVQEHAVQSSVIFRIAFSDRRQPLIITRAMKSDYNDFWTSVPEGRQREAEQIGALIAAHLKQNA